MSPSPIAPFRKILVEHHKRLQKIPLATLYDNNPQRAQNFSLRLDNLLFDFSRNLIDEQALTALLRFATSANLEEQRDAMLQGALVNQSEQRAALHTALRSQSRQPLLSAWGQDERPTFLLSRQVCKNFAKAWQAGKICNAQGEPLTELLHVGIGGSNLGTRLLATALEAEAAKRHKTATQQRARLSFVSNFDALSRLLSTTRPALDLRRCLVFVVSKSFRTEETLYNAKALMRLLRPLAGEDLWRHFVAVTASPEAVSKVLPLSLPSERIFLLPASVGGRYSVWSAVSLSAELLLGTNLFEQFLKGAEVVDRHFRQEPLEKNIPVVMGLLSVWYRNFWGFSNHAVFPYDSRLRSVPSFLQQLAMESGGKGVRLGRGGLIGGTAPLLWGGEGSGAQHSVFQWLHQGTENFSCDFWLGAKGRDKAVQARLTAHCFAQMEVLMRGRKAGGGESVDDTRGIGRRLSRHGQLAGGHPSSLLLYSDFSAYVLGMLLALYEHRVFVEGVLWGTNPFDQWGVEAGKVVVRNLARVLGGEGDGETGSLRDAVAHWRKMGS